MPEKMLPPDLPPEIEHKDKFSILKEGMDKAKLESEEFYQAMGDYYNLLANNSDRPAHLYGSC